MKRIFLLLLVISTAALISACAENGAGGPEAEPNSADVTAPPPDDANNGEESVEPAGGPPSPFSPTGADFEGYNFRVAGFYSYQHAWIAAGYSEIYAEELTGVPINDAIFNRNAAVEALYNIEISLFPLSYGDRGGHAATLLRSILAGDDAFDAAMVIQYQLPPLLTRPGALVDLHSIGTLELGNPWWDHNSVAELSVANRLFTVTGDMSLYSAFGSIVMYFNKELVASYGLDNPYDLVRAGTWTWDELHAMSRAVARDLNGDGVFDHRDQVGVISESASMLASLIAGGVRLSEKDANDMPVMLPVSVRLTNSVDTLLAAMRDPHTAVNVAEVSGFGNPFFDWALPKFRDGEALFFYNQLLVALNLRAMEADFGIVPAPKLDAAQERFGSFANDHWITYLVIPQTNTDLERTGAILEAIGYYSQRLVMPAFYGVTVTHQLMRDECSVEMLDIILGNRVYDLANIYNWGSTRQMFMDLYVSSVNNVAAMLEARQGAIQAAMGRTLEQLVS